METEVSFLVTHAGMIPDEVYFASDEAESLEHWSIERARFEFSLAFLEAHHASM